ncbi:hypothetical protein ATK36_4007 [Amycolatopsis sulphurea]|uniref:Uncharacterized protein n=1 Tax=Amycolatopsis sulphurea TaxID=76022 RepID=A0A2A9FEN5_9PSEU|nr:hypothetical protein ATK36_4007 [Amycolatopsis sulphurea]
MTSRPVTSRPVTSRPATPGSATSRPAAPDGDRSRRSALEHHGCRRGGLALGTPSPPSLLVRREWVGFDRSRGVWPGPDGPGLFVSAGISGNCSARSGLCRLALQVVGRLSLPCLASHCRYDTAATSADARSRRSHPMRQAFSWTPLSARNECPVGFFVERAPLGGCVCRVVSRTGVAHKVCSPRRGLCLTNTLPRAPRPAPRAPRPARAGDRRLSQCCRSGPSNRAGDRPLPQRCRNDPSSCRSGAVQEASRTRRSRA